MEGAGLAQSIFGLAVTITDAYARALLRAEGMTWGPRHVRVAAGLPQVDELLFATLGDEEPWRDEWGDEVDLTQMAENKLLQSLRAHAPSGTLASRAPWHLRSGDYLTAGGVCSEDNAIAVGVAGAHGLANEAIAQVLLLTMVQLYRQWAEGLREGRIERLP